MKLLVLIGTGISIIGRPVRKLATLLAVCCGISKNLVFQVANPKKRQAMIDQNGNDPTSSVLEKQPIYEGDVGHGLYEQRLTDSQVVFVEGV